MAAKLGIKDLLSSVDKEVQAILARNIRDSDLNKRPHVLDISEHSLSLNGSPAFKELYSIFIETVKANVAKNVATLGDIDPGYFKGKTAYITYVDNPRVLIGTSYDSIQKVIRKVSRDPKLVNTVYGVRSNASNAEVTNLDIGHIASADSPYFISPAEQRISSLLDTLAVHTDERLNAKVEKAFNDLVNIQSHVDYTIRKLSGDLAQIEGLLGTVFVAVTLQTSEVNQKVYNPIETEILNRVRYDIATTLAKPYLIKKFLEHTSSNSIIEDITERVIAILKGVKPNIVTHPERKSTTPSKSRIKKTPIPKTPDIKTDLSKVKTLQNKSYSLASLQTLLNTHLQNVVAANMGNGEDRMILNYRTGRFAASTRVERLSMGKEGMITAFYSYMRNPYGTFSEGGRQQYPKTRDPKLLISQSIKEIAATRVANRMRAVLV